MRIKSRFVAASGTGAVVVVAAATGTSLAAAHDMASAGFVALPDSVLKPSQSQVEKIP
jgi:hypothetical protein